MGNLISWWSTAQAISRPGPQQVGKLNSDFFLGAASSSQSPRKLANIYHVPVVYEMYFGINCNRKEKVDSFPSFMDLIFQLGRWITQT